MREKFVSESRVFFFGAGASKEEGGLLTSQLLFESLKNRDVKQEFSDLVKDFLRDLFFVEDVNNIASEEDLPEFEELLTIVDLSLLKKEEFSTKWNNAALIKLREALIYCMARILEIKLRPPETEDRYQECHKTLVRKIFDKGSRIGENSFISLNYDILLDNAILNMHPEIHTDYAIDFRNFTPPDPDRKTKLLKLHGSLNWALCPVCNSLWIKLGGKIADKIISERIKCERDQAVQQTLLVPPTWLKEYNNPHLAKIWLEAEYLLQKANAVYFIGYSLPQSDYHIKYLLKKALLQRNPNSRIIVVTSTDNEEGSDLHKRYRRFFGPIDYRPIGFRQFVKEFDVKNDSM
jgi:hypothetical protein